MEEEEMRQKRRGEREERPTGKNKDRACRGWENEHRIDFSGSDGQKSSLNGEKCHSLHQ